MEKVDILERIDELLQDTPRGVDTAVRKEELQQGTTSLLSLIYGLGSPQLVTYTKYIEQIRARKNIYDDFSDHEIIVCCHGALRSLKREIERGLTGNFRQRITGEILTDLIQLSRTVLSETGDNAKNVASVLAAAAFEDAIRRMGKSFAGVMGNDDFSGVLKKLKDADVMQGPQVGIAQSYLSFRNHALHANWDSIEKESIHSVLGFVEQLLLKHFN